MSSGVIGQSGELVVDGARATAHARTQNAAMVARVRSMYPALNSGGGSALLDNAGGSQLPGVVIDAMTNYLRRTYVQLGADYAESLRATAVVVAAHRFVKVFMGAEVDPSNAAPDGFAGHVILGASTSQLVYTLAHAYARVMSPDDQIIVSQASHESNAGAWFNMGKADGPRPGVGVGLWTADPITGEHRPEELEGLLNERTRLVCFPHVSNILGRVEDVRAIVELVKRRTGGRARVLVDGVAYAPHRAMRVAQWGCDWYVYSTYKVFGPHMAALFGTHAALAELTGPNHFFIPRQELPRTFELGGVSHEGAAGILALDHYLRDLCDAPRLADLAHPDARFEHAIVERAFGVIEALETPLHERLLAFLSGCEGVRVIGPQPGSPEDRVGIVSFVKAGVPSAQIARAGNALGLGFRFGHFYAYRLCQAMGLSPESRDAGVVRVSFCHTNTEDEVDRLIEFLRGCL